MSSGLYDSGYVDAKKKYDTEKRASMSQKALDESLQLKREREAKARAGLPKAIRLNWLKDKQIHEKTRRDNMTPDKKQEWLEQKRAHERSRTDNMENKEQFYEEKRSREKSRRDGMSPEARDRISKQSSIRMASKRKSERTHGISIEQAGINFRRTLSDLPEFVCTCCHRLLWRRSVIKFDRSKYDMTSDVVKKCLAEDIMYETKPKEIYICTTCNSSLKRTYPAMPAQAVANGLRLEPTPPDLQNPNEMERMTFRRKIPFIKLGNLPRGRQYRLQGPCVNVPSNLDSVCSLLPRLPNDALLVPIKLKRRLCYKGHYMYEAIRPSVVLDWILWLKQNNPHYSDVEIQLDFCNLMACYEKGGKSLSIEYALIRSVF